MSTEYVFALAEKLAMSMTNPSFWLGFSMAFGIVFMIGALSPKPEPPTDPRYTPEGLDDVFGGDK